MRAPDGSPVLFSVAGHFARRLCGTPRRQRQAYTTYQTELRAQMEQRQRERKEKEEEELREQQQLEQMEQEKLEKKDEVMARPNDGVLHPFRKAAIVQEQE